MKQIQATTTNTCISPKTIIIFCIYSSSESVLFIGHNQFAIFPFEISGLSNIMVHAVFCLPESLCLVIIIICSGLVRQPVFLRNYPEPNVGYLDQWLRQLTKCNY